MKEKEEIGRIEEERIKYKEEVNEILECDKKESLQEK